MPDQNNSPGSILVVEDDRAIRDSIDRALRSEGHAVATAHDGADALTQLGTSSPDLIVMDVMMPNVDGLTLCRTLRQRGDTTPILMVTARHLVGDRVAGLDAGADDYLVKPFDLDELLARVRALLRRSLPDDDHSLLAVEDLELDTAGRRCRRRGREIELTKTEFDLLRLLMEHDGVVLTRSTIYERIWGYEFETGSKSLDVYVGYLRRKTEEQGEPRLIQTVRGVGYTLRTP